MNVNAFAELTGLTVDAATACLAQCESQEEALASFVQSLDSIPSTMFRDSKVHQTNALAINATLRAAYSVCRGIIASKQCSDKEAWVAFAAARASEQTAATSSSSTASSSTAAKTASPFATANSAAANPFATATASLFGTKPSPSALAGPSSQPPKPESTGPFQSPLGQGNNKAQATNPFTSTTSTAATKPSTAPFSSDGKASPFGSKTTTNPFAAASQPSPGSSPFGNTSTTNSLATVGATTSTANKVPKVVDNEASKAQESTAPAAAKPASTPFAFGTTSAGHASFGFGQKPATSTPAPAAPQNAGTGSVSFGFGQKPAASAPTAPTAQEAPAPAPAAPVEIARPTYVDTAPHGNVGPLLSMPRFWELEVEGRCTLLNLDRGFVAKHRDTLRDRMMKWVDKTENKFHRQPVSYVKIVDPDEKVARVILRDAERTFFAPEHREKLANFLYAMYYEFRSYGQAMSYLAGICLLALTEAETATVLRRVSKDYIPGHWAEEAVGFATSAWLVEHIMQRLYPDVAKHFQAINFWPDTYLQKIMSGLCIHVLDFADLFEFLDEFMQHGMRYLIKFCLGIVDVFHTRLVSRGPSSMNELYEYMRLDRKAIDSSDVCAVLAAAKRISLGDDDGMLDVLRMVVYDKKVAPRIQRAPKTEAFEPCCVCEKEKPTWYHDELGKVCQPCKTKSGYPEAEFEKY